MEVLTRQTAANEAAARFRETYASRPELTFPGATKSAGKMLAELEALPATPDPDAVDAIIENTSWTSVPNCDECGADEAAVIRLGQSPDEESRYSLLCLSCVKKAVAELIATDPAAIYTEHSAAVAEQPCSVHGLHEIDMGEPIA